MKQTTKTPVIVAITNGLAGVMAWAYRLRQNFPEDSNYSIQLLGCRNSDNYDHIDLKAWNIRQARYILQNVGEAIVIPNFLFDLFDVSHDLIRSEAPLRTIGFCRSDSWDEYYEPLSHYQELISSFIAVSDHCAQQLALHLPNRKLDISVLPTGIDYPNTLAREYSKNPLQIIYAGRLEQKQKRVMDLIPLVRYLLEREINFKLTIAGGGRFADELMRQLNALQHGKRVTPPQLWPYDQMAACYRKHDLFIQLSAFEGTSNSLLEAMAQGVIPIVTETSSGSRSVIRDSKNGYLVPIGDMNAMADCIQNLYQMNSNELQKLGQQAYTSVKDFAMSNYIDRFTAILDQTMASPRRIPRDLNLSRNVSYGLTMLP